MCEVRGSRALGISARKVNIEAYTQKHDLIYHLVGHMWEWPLLSDDCMMSGTAYVWWQEKKEEESSEYFFALKFILTALCAQILRLSTASTEEAFLTRGCSE